MPYAIFRLSLPPQLFFEEEVWRQLQITWTLREGAEAEPSVAWFEGILTTDEKSCCLLSTFKSLLPHATSVLLCSNMKAGSVASLALAVWTHESAL
jgi:hypothetical protein